MEDLKELYDDAIRIAAAAHAYQRDKGGMPYILHPLRVSMACGDIETKIVAVLHDTIEDTTITADYLRENGFTDNIVQNVELLTRRKNEDYKSYIERVKTSSIATEVKLHDLKDNMNIMRIKKLDETDLKRLNKYLNAYRFLKDE